MLLFWTASLSAVHVTAGSISSIKHHSKNLLINRYESVNVMWWMGKYTTASGKCCIISFLNMQYFQYQAPQQEHLMDSSCHKYCSLSYTARKSYIQHLHKVKQRWLNVALITRPTHSSPKRWNFEIHFPSVLDHYNSSSKSRTK